MMTTMTEPTPGPHPKPINERAFRETISHLSPELQALQLIAVGLEPMPARHTNPRTSP
jgi:hypothetical protein